MGVTFIDGDCVGDTVARIKDNTSGTAGGIQGEHGLDGDVHGRGVEGLEHDLGHLLPVGLGVEGGFRQEDRVFLWSNTELVVESVVPDLLHVVPVGDDTVLDGVLQGEDTPLGLGLVTDVRAFCPIPTITPWCLGLPTIEGNAALGASSPANPALHIPDPLSTTRAATSSSAIVRLYISVTRSDVTFSVPVSRLPPC